MSLETPQSLIASQDPSEGRSKWKLWIGIGAGVILLGLGYRLVFGGAKAPDGGGQRPVPVVAVPAQKGDLIIHLAGLGTVTPTDTVTVRSRVDGQINRVCFTEGQIVRQGEVLVEIDPRPFQVQLMQAEGQMAKDEASAKNARMDLERYRTLAQQGILAKQQLDAQTSTVTQNEAALKADQAQVESARLNLTYSRVTAPLTGRVGLRMVDPGNMVHASDQGGLAVITPTQPINVVFTIPGDAIQQVLKKQAAAPMGVEAFDRDLKNRIAAGRLMAIDNQVDPGTGTVKLKAQFGNEDQSLFPNQFVNAQLQLDTLKDAILVPTAAVQRSPQGSFVFVVKADATVEMRVVEVQAVEGDRTALRKGVAAGESVVIEGIERLRDGSKVSLPQAGGAKK